MIKQQIEALADSADTYLAAVKKHVGGDIAMAGVLFVGADGNVIWKGALDGGSQEDLARILDGVALRLRGGEKAAIVVLPS